MMECLTSDDSCDSEISTMRNQLREYGLPDEKLSKEEMANLLKALNNSKDDTHKAESAPRLKRRYLSVKDPRMPWSLLPADVTAAQRARTLTVYVKLLAINRYRAARQSLKYKWWEPAKDVGHYTMRATTRATRSGRHVPLYDDADDDSTDLDFVLTTKKRKISDD